MPVKKKNNSMFNNCDNVTFTYIAFHRKVRVMRLVSWNLYKHTPDNLFLQLCILPFRYL